MAGNYTLANKLHIFVLLVVLTVVGLAWFFPREPKVSEETIGKLNDLVTLMGVVSNHVDTALTEQRAINLLLLNKYQKREAANEVAYDDLLEKYGLPDAEPTGTVPNDINPDKKDPPVIEKSGNDGGTNTVNMCADDRLCK